MVFVLELGQISTHKTLGFRGHIDNLEIRMPIAIYNKKLKLSSILVLILCGPLLISCGGGGGANSSSQIVVGNPTTPIAAPDPLPNPAPTAPPVTAQYDIFNSKEQAALFLSRATFGATQQEIDNLESQSASQWFVRQVSLPTSETLPFILNRASSTDYVKADGTATYQGALGPEYSFYINAVTKDDQLRQRVAFALSQILVVSNTAEGSLKSHPEMLAYFMDLMSEHAFGNYRDLLESVVYSPAMSYMLTYHRNLKENMNLGRVPDENFARELLQLFTIGLVELNMDGSVKTGSDGRPIETYTNDDIIGLAKVFTGLAMESSEFWGNPATDRADRYYKPLKIFSGVHSPSEKSFLDTTIPAGTSASEAIDMALDAVFEHPNVAPFISKRLIQRFVTSNPTAEYVAFVSDAFENGIFTLPNGMIAGIGKRGDLQATIAAILFYEGTLADDSLSSATFGKVREPILRFTHWARAFKAAPVDPETSTILKETYKSKKFSQGPYGAPSVFSFFGPDYVAPQTEMGRLGLVAPEFQLMNAAALPGYINTMTRLIYSQDVKGTFLPDYDNELALATNVVALVDHLDLLLMSGQMSEETKATLIELAENVDISTENDPAINGRLERVQLLLTAIFLSPDYLVQQ